MSEKKVIDGFMCEEYKSVATSHDNMREMVGRTFNYFLLISAFPFTAYTFSKIESNSTLTWLLPVLFIVVALGDVCMALAMLEARLSQYRYARAVNLIRKYYVDTSPELDQYMYLPTSPDFPEYDFSALGFVKYEVGFVMVIALSYFSIALWQIGASIYLIFIPTILLFLVSVRLGSRIITRFEKRHASIVKSKKRDIAPA